MKIFILALLSVAASPIWGNSLGCDINPIIPFLAVTGQPAERDLLRKVDALQRDGYEQFLIYARSGLQVKYMGDEWLDAVETLCREAERRNMKVWLYDEYNWPSGTCKGRVPNESLAYRYHEWAVFRNADGTYRWDNTFAPAGWVNVCDPRAVRRFIELTHEVYERRLAKYFVSKTIRGMFTDEPGHPTAISFKGTPAAHFCAWDGLEDEYRKSTGRDFRADVEANLDGVHGAEVWEVYADLMGERFRISYFDQIRHWCDRMGILSTGHMIGEGELDLSCGFNGNPLRVLKGESLPGIDEIQSACDWNGRMEWITLGVVQHAAIRNGRGGLAELYALGPNDMSAARLRQMVWLMAMFGVDNYLVSMQVMDHRGLVEKHGYLSPIQEGQPWHGQLQCFFDDAKKAASYARRLDYVKAAAIRYPQRAAARQKYAGGKQADLGGLIREVSGRQMAFDLIEETESTNLKAVFVVQPGGSFYEERTGRTFADAATAAKWLREGISARVRYLERDGTLALGLLVREYPDGSSVALDILNKGDRLLLAEIDGVCHSCMIPGRGVLTLRTNEKPKAPFFGMRATLASRECEYRLDRANVRRASFATNRVAKVVVGERVGSVRFALRTCALSYAVTESGRPVDEFEVPPEGEKIFRHAAEPYRFELDGRPLSATRSCCSLPLEYCGLYAETEDVEISPGEHTLRLVSGEEDRNFFLPAAFVVGSFAVRDGSLVALPEKLRTGQSLEEQGLADYCGTVTYILDGVKPPEAGAELELGTGGLFARIAWNGVDCGVRGWGPYRWRLGNCDTGSGRLEVTIYTPVVNICGGVDRMNAGWDLAFWTKPRDQEYTAGLFDLSWLVD